ncbi:glycosyltransferase [Intrasporangium sp.]|uniref:glycosyltransferase n=1 Tax=Intrasporangium sp. TaxID=1925024 RepID=UPI00293A5A32|nr:glycosyltransferase [Intrasporangium sp.]MDV3222906.1 putative rhamnosyl transferase [Intrasporangium sp.]
MPRSPWANPPRVLRAAARRVRHVGREITSRTAVAWSHTADDVPPAFFGWTRYSQYYRGTSAFKTSRAFPDEDAYKARLWSAERMGPRATMFLELSVPLLQQMRKEHVYRHVVSYSPEMPEPWLGQLLAAAERYDVLELLPAGSGGVPSHFERVLERVESPSRTVVWFRVDDDDLLSIDYLDRLAVYSTRSERGRGVSMARGYSALWHDGVMIHPREARRPLGSQGQAYVGAYDHTSQRLTMPRPGDHSTVDRRMPTILDSRFHTFLQLRHAGQDTQSGEAEPFELLHRRHTSIAAVSGHSRLLELFPTVAGVLRETLGPGTPAST